MATLKTHARQYQLTAIQEVNAADLLPAGLSAINIDLPPGAIITGGGTLVVTPFNATGAGLLDIGLTGGSATAFANDVNIEAAAYTAFTTGIGTYLPNGGSISLTGVATDGATAGKLQVLVHYVVVGRGNEVQD